MRTALGFVLVACVLFSGDRLPAAETDVDLLNLVPDSAAGVLLINRPQETAKRIETLTKNLRIGGINPLAFAKAITGINEGLDERRSLGVVLFAEDEDAELAAVLFLPV